MRHSARPQVFLALCACAAAMLGGCQDSFEIAVGPNQDVEIFSDLPPGDERVALVGELLERKVETPVRPESLFRVTLADPGSFRSMRDYRNLVVVGDLRGTGWAADLCREVIGSDGRESLVAAGTGYVFTRDVWARGQTLLFVHAPEVEALRRHLAERGAALLEQLGERVIEGLRETLYLPSGEQSAMAAGIAQRHGYTLRIPGDYLVDEDRESRFVRLKRIQPGEPVGFLFVYYEPRRLDLDDPRLPTLCIALRDTLARRYFGGDWVEPSRTTARATTFLGRPALELYGLYQNDAPMGGPFRMYAFHEGERLYLIDLAVFNPPGRKLPFMRQLEAIARTFRTEGERLLPPPPGR